MTIDDEVHIYIPKKCYFMFAYYDDDCVYPMLTTLVYIGSALELKDRLQAEEGFLYFQDAESYANHGFLNSYGHKLDKDEIIIKEISEAIAKKTIFDINGIVQKLMRWNKTRSD